MASFLILPLFLTGCSAVMDITPVNHPLEVRRFKPLKTIAAIAKNPSVGGPVVPGLGPIGLPSSGLSNPLAKFSQAVALATEILEANKNPFLSKLPKLERPFSPGMLSSDLAGGPMPVQTNPLDFVVLLGVVYNPQKPFAIISIPTKEENASLTKTAPALSSDGSPEGVGSQMVQKGDIVTVNSTQVRIAKIFPDAVELSEVGQASHTKKLTLPNMVGYRRTAPGTPPAEEESLASDETAAEKLTGSSKDGAEPATLFGGGKSALPALGDVLNKLKKLQEL